MTMNKVVTSSSLVVASVRPMMTFLGRAAAGREEGGRSVRVRGDEDEGAVGAKGKGERRTHRVEDDAELEREDAHELCVARARSAAESSRPRAKREGKKKRTCAATGLSSIASV